MLPVNYSIGGLQVRYSIMQMLGNLILPMLLCYVLFSFPHSFSIMFPSSSKYEVIVYSLIVNNLSFKLNGVLVFTITNLCLTRSLSRELWNYIIVWSNQFLNIVWNFYNNNSSSKIDNSKWNNKIIFITVILMLCKFLVKTSLPNPGLREKINLNFYFHTSLWCLKRSYVVVIARCRVQYGKYFPRFS